MNPWLRVALLCLLAGLFFLSLIVIGGCEEFLGGDDAHGGRVDLGSSHLISVRTSGE